VVSYVGRFISRPGFDRQGRSRSTFSPAADWATSVKVV
jgi:hypothetical protein